MGANDQSFVVNCNNGKSTFSKGYAYHQIPAAPILRRNAWIRMTGRNLWKKRREMTITQNTKLCSLHFVSGRKRNDPTNFDYIPTQNLIPLQHCTPNQISDVSSLCGGAASDKFIVQNSGVLNPIKLGDNVMADRGFDNHLELNRNGASLKIKISVVK